MLRHTVVLQYDSTDKIYIASVPELQGCAAHGKTQEEAIKEINIVYDMWIKTANEKGIEIPEPFQIKQQIYN